MNGAQRGLGGGWGGRGRAAALLVVGVDSLIRRALQLVCISISRLPLLRRVREEWKLLPPTRTQ